MNDAGGPPPAVVSGLPSTAVPGTYTVTYTCTDEAGNETDGLRAVSVVDDTTMPGTTVTGGIACDLPSVTPYVPLLYTSPLPRDRT